MGLLSGVRVVASRAMELTLHLTILLALVVIFVAYRYARLRAAAGSPRFQWVNSWVRPGAERLWVTFGLAWLVVTAIDYFSGGALSHADRFWVGLALGLVIGMLALALVVRRAAQR